MEKVSERVLTDTASLDRCPAAGAALKIEVSTQSLDQSPQSDLMGLNFFSFYLVCMYTQYL